MSMNGINPIQVNPVNIAQAPPQAQQRPTVDAVRTLAVQIRRQTAELIPLANNFYTAWMVFPQAQAIDTSLLYHITGDAEVLQGQQPQDRANLAALHAEWAQDDAIDPYALQR